MGEPVWSARSTDPVENEGLWYADAGSTWTLIDDYGKPDRGVDCSLWFEEGTLKSVKIFIIERLRECTCTQSACESGWFDLCFSDPAVQALRRAG